MNKIIITSLALFLTISAGAQNTKSKSKMTDAKSTAQSAEMKTKVDSTSYALGVLIGTNLKQQGFDGINMEVFEKAMKEIFQNKATAMTSQQAQTIVQKYAQEQMKVKSEKNKADGKAYLEKNKTKPGVVVTPSGLQYEVIKEGNGQTKPGPNSQVTAHYHGTLIDGTVFDSSVQRNQPFKTSVGGVIKAWQEALQLMTPGTKLRIVCPSEIAYGERGQGSIGPNSVLIFEMELISIDVQ